MLRKFICQWFDLVPAEEYRRVDELRHEYSAYVIKEAQARQAMNQMQKEIEELRAEQSAINRLQKIINNLTTPVTIVNSDQVSETDKNDS